MQDGRDQSLYQAALREFNGGDRPAARRSCGELLVRHPGLAPLLHLMGLITNAEGQPREARALITTAIAAEPSVADYRNSLGVVLAGTDQFGPALTAFDAALGLRPAYAAAHRNRGHALERLGRPDESALAYRAALRLEPADFATWQSLLAVCHQCWDLAGAIECRRRTAELRPADAVLGSDLLYMLHYSPELTPRQMLAEHMEWAARFCNAGIAHEGELGDEKTEGRKRAEGADGSTDAGPVILNDVQRAGSLFHEGNGRIAHEGHEGARSEGGIKAGKCADCAAVSSAPVNEGQQAFPKERSGAAGSPPEPNTSSSLRVTSCSSWAVPANGSSAAQRRLRVGYVSPDFREHTPPRFLAGALMHHDPGAFEVFCYSDVREGDHVTAALQPMGPAGSWPDGPAWRETAGLDDAALEAMVRADRIDILVDLRGHGSGNRLKVFARRPAPVQVNMIGYFNTTGLPTMDWRITDERQDPFDCAQGRPAVGQAPGLLPRAQNHRRNAYATGTERLARLPGGCWCYVAGDAFGDPSPPVLPPPALRAGRVTFGSLNKIVKISVPCARLWAQVVMAVPESRLLLPAAGDTADFIRGRMREAGLPEGRLALVGKARGRDGYLRRFNEIDVSLDPWPFNGITTTCDSLWMGVPVVSLAGGTTVSRAGRSILHSAGLADLAVDTPEAYVRRAAELAGDPGKLREQRLGMRGRLARSNLMDQRRFAAELGAAYLHMWRERKLARPVS